jgi:hypothetical protein
MTQLFDDILPNAELRLAAIRRLPEKQRFRPLEQLFRDLKRGYRRDCKTLSRDGSESGNGNGALKIR